MLAQQQVPKVPELHIEKCGKGSTQSAVHFRQAVRSCIDADLPAKRPTIADMLACRKSVVSVCKKNRLLDAYAVFSFGF